MEKLETIIHEPAVDTYDSVVELNAIVIFNVLSYRENKRKELLVYIYNLLKPIIAVEIRKVCSSLSLKSLRHDMEQDAFLKLLVIIRRYEFDRCPSFVTFYRRSLHNRLLTKYGKTIKERASELNDMIEDKESHFAEKPKILQVLTDKCLEKFGERDIIKVILSERILSYDKTTQRDLAGRFGVTSGYISRLENSILRKIRKEFSELF